MPSYGVRKSIYILRDFDLYPGLHGWKDEKFLLPEGWKDEKFLLPEGWCFLHLPSPSMAYSFLTSRTFLRCFLGLPTHSRL